MSVRGRAAGSTGVDGQPGRGSPPLEVWRSYFYYVNQALKLSTQHPEADRTRHQLVRKASSNATFACFPPRYICSLKERVAS